MQLQQVFCAFLLFLSSQHTWMWSVEIQQLFWTVKTEAIKLGWWRENRTSHKLVTWNHKINPVCLPREFLHIREKKISALVNPSFYDLSHPYPPSMVSPSSHTLQRYYLWLDSNKVWCDHQFPPFLPLCFYHQLSSQTFPSPFSCIFRHWMCWFLQHTRIIHFLLRTINHTTTPFFFHLSIHSFIFIVLHLSGAACYDLLSPLLTSYFLNLHSVNLLPICRNVKSRNLSSLVLSYLGFCNMMIFYCSWSPSLS